MMKQLKYLLKYLNIIRFLLVWKYLQFKMRHIFTYN